MKNREEEEGKRLAGDTWGMGRGERERRKRESVRHGAVFARLLALPGGRNRKLLLEAWSRETANT